MAVKARLNINVGGSGVSSGTRALYYIHNFVDSWLSANGFANRLEVAFSNPGSGGNWLSETGPGDNAYAVIQPKAAFAFGDGSRWQLLFAARSTNTAGSVGNKGNLAISGRGLYAAFSPNGGWDDARCDWGASPNPLASPLGIVGGSAVNFYGSALTFHLSCVERMTSGVADGIILNMVGEDGASTNFCLTAGHSRWNEAATRPVQYFNGQPDLGGSAQSIAVIAGTFGKVPKPDNSGLNAARAYGIRNTGSIHLNREGKWVGFPIELVDASLGRTVGYLEGVYNGDEAIGDGQQDSNSLFICYGGTLWPIG